MDLVHRTLRWQRLALAGTAAASALVFWRGGLDIFGTVKATAIVVGLLVLVLIGGVRAARTRRLEVPLWTPIWVALGGFTGALVVATLVSDTVALSVVGRPGRHTGLAMYLVYLALLVAALRLHVDHRPRELSRGLLAAVAPITAYGFAQVLDLDPLGWTAVEGGPQVFGTLGNANFFAALLGIATPLALATALDRVEPTGWRVLGGLLAVAMPVAGFLSASLQGPLAAVVGAAVVLGVVVWQAPGLRAARVPLTGVLGVLGVGLVGALLTGVGPFAAIREQATRSLTTRMGKWETALAMLADRPLLGFGLGSFEDWFFAYRPVAVAVETGLRRSTDAPHNVPLEMLASGGLLLGLAYLALVAVTAWALVLGLRRRTGADRLALAGAGGAWVAYQVQSLVSIDVPPIAALHYVLAGVIVGYGAVTTLRGLGDSPATDLRAAPGRKGAKRKTGPALHPVPPAFVAGAAVLTIAVLWAGTLPLRADLAAGAATRIQAQGRFPTAEAAWERAMRVGFWESRYPARHADLYQSRGRLREARDLQEVAVRREPRGLANHLNVARLSVELGDLDRAAAAYDAVLAIDPSTPEVLVEVGEFRLEHGDAEGGRALLDRAAELEGEAPA
jgi:putative inorganic carbon (hco3(-)) transporter